MSKNDYHATRFEFDVKRKIVWTTLVRHYFDRYSHAQANVLEIGAGYCDFINEISGTNRYAFDIWEGIRNFAAPGVTTLVGDVSQLDVIPDQSLDLAFASNVFEHIEQSDLKALLLRLSAKLKQEGVLVAIQPNYRYAYREYFDDYTHCSIWTDVSLVDFLAACGYEAVHVAPRFLPLSLKSKLPTWGWLIRLYLMLPFKLMGKQMMIVFRKRKG